MRIAFAGTPEFARVALARIRAAGFEVALVLTQPDRPSGRGMKLVASPVKSFALEHGIAVAQPRSLRLDGRFGDDARAAREALQAASPDAMVVAAYGLILPQDVLDLPRHGCLNIHASLLPRWRGAAPIQRAVLAGDAASGVTIMQMDAGLDTGPILAQQQEPIMRGMTSAALHDVLARSGAQLLLTVIAALEAGTATPRAQPAEGVTYAHKLAKHEALIDWSASAADIARQVQGCNPWPVAETSVDGLQLRIWQADALEAPTEEPTQTETAPPAAASAAALPGAVLGLVDSRLQVACGTGVLAIERLQCAGRRVVSAAEFAHSHPLDGLKFGSP